MKFCLKKYYPNQIFMSKIISYYYIFVLKYSKKTKEESLWQHGNVHPAEKQKKVDVSLKNAQNADPASLKK